MPGDLSIGGGVYIYIPSAGVDYWPVTGVTEPQHYWPFSETGDYTDQGSTGGFTLTEQGSGNSFNSGLVLNGSGYANYPSIHADLNNIGSTFSLLLELHIDAASGYQMGMCVATHGGGTDEWELWVPYNSTRVYWMVASTAAVKDFLLGDTNYQIIITSNTGTLAYYVNGSSAVFEGSPSSPVENTTDYFTIGALSNAGYPLTGTIKRAGLLKGAAWSADDVAAIYATLP